MTPEERVDDTGQIRNGSDYEIYDEDGIWLGTQSLRYSPKYISAEFVYCSYLSAEGPRFERFRIIPMVPELAIDRTKY